MFEDDVTPPNDPPIITDPYDEFVNGDAIRYKCPGTNLRKTFIISQSVKPCFQWGISDYISFPVREHTCSTKRIPFEIPEDYYRVYRTCSSNPLLVDSTDMQVGFIKNQNISCKTLDASFSRMLKRLCTTRLRTSDLVVGSFPGTCRWNKDFFYEIFGTHLCRKVHSTVDHLILTRIRRQCFYYAFPSFLGKHLCHAFPITHQVFEIRYLSNLGKCRLTPAVDPSAYVFVHLCKSQILVENVPILFSTAMPRVNIINCRIHPTLVQQFALQRGHCGNKKGLAFNYFRYRFITCQLRMKMAPQQFGSLRVRCGVMVLGTPDALTFGRVWGGRNPLPFSLPTSGRMIVKIRDK